MAVPVSGVGAPPSRRYGDSLGTVTSAEPQPSLWISLRSRKSRTACMPSTPLRLVLLPAAANPSNLHMVDYSTGLVMQRAHMAIDIAYSVRKTAGFQRFFAIRPCKTYKMPYENGLRDDGGYNHHHRAARFTACFTRALAAEDAESRGTAAVSQSADCKAQGRTI